MHLIILSSVACPASPYFSTLSQKGTIFGKKFWFPVQRLCEIFLILRRIQRDVINVQTFSCTVLVCRSCQFKGNLNIQISNFINIYAMGAELSHADGRTDRHDKANSRFPQFWKRAQKRAVWLTGQRQPPAVTLNYSCEQSPQTAHKIDKGGRSVRPKFDRQNRSCVCVFIHQCRTLVSYT